MSSDSVLYFGKSSIMLIFHLSMPAIGAAVVVGLIVALFQTLIQLQEQTVAFAAKLTAVIAMFVISGGWMAATLLRFQEQIFTQIASP